MASVVGLPLSFYLYYAAKEHPRLTHYVHPVKATLVQSGEASSLGITFNNTAVRTDITAAQVALWNEGQRSIRPADVLRHIQIKTEGAPILQATIRKTSREVTGFRLDDRERDRGIVAVGWDILENGDGGVVQIIYAGSTNVRVTLEGAVAGQREIERVEFSGKIRTAYEQYESERKSYRSWGYLWLGAAILLIWVASDMRRPGNFPSYLQTQLIKTFEEHVDFYVGNIAHERQLIAQNEQFIADVKEQTTKRLADAPNLGPEAVHELQQRQLDRIAQYEKEQEACRRRIDEFEAKRQEIRLRKGVEEQRQETQRRRFGYVVIGVAAFGLVMLAVAVYLVFIARPIGPPFGF